MKKFNEIAKDDIHLENGVVLSILEGASKALGIKNPFVKKYGENYARIYKTPI